MLTHSTISIQLKRINIRKSKSKSLHLIPYTTDAKPDSRRKLVQEYSRGKSYVGTLGVEPGHEGRGRGRTARTQYLSLPSCCVARGAAQLGLNNQRSKKQKNVTIFPIQFLALRTFVLLST